MIKAVIFDMFETLITHFESPLYFGRQIAEDAGLSEAIFREIWDATEDERTIGKMSFEEVIEKILKTNDCYSEEKMNTIIAKRIAVKKDCFNHLHSEIIPMLAQLKEKGIKIGLISNCFSEETAVIRESVLFPYFDEVCLSYEQGMAKPDTRIFLRCMEHLKVNADECLYVGDGGSLELETAKKLGMRPLQAVWYLRQGATQPAKRKKEFVQMETPLEVVEALFRH